MAGLLPAPALGQDPPSPPALGDVHVHLFNLSDLPARGFFEHGVLWNMSMLRRRPVRGLWLAILELIEFFRTRTITAAEELEQYGGRNGSAERISEPEFDRLAWERIRAFARQSRRFDPGAAPGSPEQAALCDSYFHLARAVRLVRILRLRFRDFRLGTPGGDGPLPCIELDDAHIWRIQRTLRQDVGPDCPEEPKTQQVGGPFAVIDATLDWAHAMMQSREYHLNTYLDLLQGDLRPTTLVNLLIDLDQWLGESAPSGSSQEDQIRFWSRIASDYASRVDIRTFAGFDPLRDAEERATLGGDYATRSHFARYQHFWRNLGGSDLPRIHGFKLYPPMGFRPIANEQSMFSDRNRALATVRRRWVSLGLPFDELAARLNRSLEDLYEFCSRHDVPLLTHARHSNEAGRCFGVRAGPTAWMDVLSRFPRLRLCLAHFAEAGDFELGMRRWDRPERVPARVWSLHGTDRLLAMNAAGPSRVYVDLGDMSEFLAGGGRRDAMRFFRYLGAYCGRFDPGCRHFLFGTDWIMLARTPRYRRYVATIRQGLIEAGWPPSWQANLLHENLQRFLEPRTS